MKEVLKKEEKLKEKKHRKKSNFFPRLVATIIMLAIFLSTIATVIFYFLNR